MFETSAAPPKFKARFPVKVPSFSFRGGRIVSFLFKVLLVLSPLLVLRGCVITYAAVRGGDVLGAEY